VSELTRFSYGLKLFSSLESTFALTLNIAPRRRLARAKANSAYSAPYIDGRRQRSAKNSDTSISRKDSTYVIEQYWIRERVEH